MKKFLTGSLIALGAFLGVARTYAGSLDDNPVVKTAQPVGFTQSIDTSKYSRISAQAVYSDGTPSSHTLSDGAKSTVTITVTDFRGLFAREAGLTITVSSAPPALVGKTITLNGVAFTEGIHWTRDSSTATTTKNISDAIQLHPSFISTYTANIVYSSAAAKGTTYNTWTATSDASTNLAFNRNFFFNGQDNAYIFLNGTTLTQGTDWTAETSTAATAKNISNAIVASSALNGVITSSHSISSTGSVIYATAAVNGINEYPISVSTNTLTLSAIKFTGGKSSDIDFTTDVITKASHGLTTAMKVLYSTTTGKVSGLSGGTTYFAIRSSDSSYKLATSSANAAAGTAVDISPLQGQSVITMTPSALVAGTAGFHWQGSNDGTNFTNLSVSSVTYSAAGNSLWDLGEYNYRYLRLNFVGPTSGGIALTVNTHGRDD